MINSGFMRYLDKLADEYGDGAEGDTMRRAAATIRALEAELSTLKAQREWVSVEDRLPELGTEVLVWNTHHESMHTDSWCELRECPVIFSTHSVATGVGWRDNDPEDISHWMPLPPAPEVK